MWARSPARSPLRCAASTRDTTQGGASAAQLSRSDRKTITRRKALRNEYSVVLSAANRCARVSSAAALPRNASALGECTTVLVVARAMGQPARYVWLQHRPVLCTCQKGQICALAVE